MTALWRFFRRRGPFFWILGFLLLCGTVAGAAIYPYHREHERTAERLSESAPVTGPDVYWNVVEGEIQDVAIVLPDVEGKRFTIELTGVEWDGVDVDEGWQPAKAGFGSTRYAPGMAFRYDLERPAVAMSEADRDRILGRRYSRWDLVVFVVSAVGLAWLVGGTVRHDRRTAPPRRTGGGDGTGRRRKTP